MKIVKIIVGVISIFLVLGFIFGGNPVSDTIVDAQMQHVENKVAEDAVKQYEIALRQGDKMQIYVQAEFVAQCYLGAKDEINYNKWKEIAQLAEKAAMNQTQKGIENMSH
jgi:hypothetical protein